MKLTVFQSDKGDCSLLETASGELLLADGGMESAYTTHVAPFLGQLHQNGKRLAIAYVSHIDDDHIAGILQMMDDKVAWRVHRFQIAHGNPGHREPRVPEPPEVDQIWHNAFHELVADNDGRIESMLAASAAILSGAADAALQAEAVRQQEFTTSKKQAIQLSRRVSAAQLNVPLNPKFRGKLMMVRRGRPLVQLGSANISIIGPFPEDLEVLRDEWNDWLEDNEATLGEIRRQAERNQQLLGQSELDRLVQPMLTQAEVFGRRSRVTPPNLASLMLLVEEQGKSLLLTGDGHADDILKGLEHHDKLDANERIHVNVLKLQHHGSEHNITPAFCEQVTADQYVICGNGFSANPDLGVLDLIVKARKRTDNKPFTMRFNAAASVVNKEPNHTHMQKVETTMQRLKDDLGARLTVQFNTQSSFQVAI